MRQCDCCCGRRQVRRPFAHALCLSKVPVSAFRKGYHQRAVANGFFICPLTSAVLRTIASTCMGGAEGNTGAGFHPQTNAVQPVSEGLGKTEGQGETRPPSNESLPHGSAGYAKRVPGRGRTAVGYSPLGMLLPFHCCTAISTVRFIGDIPVDMAQGSPQNRVPSGQVYRRKEQRWMRRKFLI